MEEAAAPHDGRPPLRRAASSLLSPETRGKLCPRAQVCAETTLPWPSCTPGRRRAGRPPAGGAQPPSTPCPAALSPQTRGTLPPTPVGGSVPPSAAPSGLESSLIPLSPRQCTSRPSGLHVRMATPLLPEPTCTSSSHSLPHHIRARHLCGPCVCRCQQWWPSTGWRGMPAHRATRATLGPQPSRSLHPPETSPPRSAARGLGIVSHGTLGTRQSVAGPCKEKQGQAGPPVPADCPAGLSRRGPGAGEGREDSREPCQLDAGRGRQCSQTQELPSPTRFCRRS